MVDSLGMVASLCMQQGSLRCKVGAVQDIPLGLSLGLIEAALQDVHLALQRLVLFGGGARIQLQDEGCILFCQHISLVLCLSLPPSSAPALSACQCCCPLCGIRNAFGYASQPVSVDVYVQSHMRECQGPPPPPQSRPKCLQSQPLPPPLSPPTTLAAPDRSNIP